MTAGADLSLFHLVRKPTIGSPTVPLLLLLHGVGSNEKDLFALAPELDGRFLIISARAPNQIGPGAHAWFHVEFTPEGPQHDPRMAAASRGLLLTFLDEVAEEYGVDPGRSYLMGFSQGAIMSLYVALTQPTRVAGVVAMSGRVLPEAEAEMAPADEFQGLPVLYVHGTHDAVLPIQYGRAAREVLSKLPIDLEYREFEMPHTVSAESFGVVKTWLSTRLEKAGRPGA